MTENERRKLHAIENQLYALGEYLGTVPVRQLHAPEVTRTGADLRRWARRIGRIADGRDAAP